MQREPTEKERLTVLLEEMHSNFKVVTERVIDLDKKFDFKIDALDEKFTSRFNDIEKAVTSITEQFIPMQFVLSDHEHRIKKIEAV